MKNTYIRKLLKILSIKTKSKHLLNYPIKFVPILKDKMWEGEN